jgi:hypothetical protein
MQHDAHDAAAAARRVMANSLQDTLLVKALFFDEVGTALTKIVSLSTGEYTFGTHLCRSERPI